MQTPIYDRYSYNWTGRSSDSANMTERQQEATPSRPQSLQLPTPAPSASRWSRTTYSLSVYEEEGFGDDGTTFHPVTPETHSAEASNTADNTVKRCIFKSRRMIIVLSALAVFAVAVALIILLTKALINGESSDPPPSSTPTRQTTTSSLAHQQQGADHSSSTASQSSTAAVVHVATQVIRTTVGTLTESAFSGASTT